MKKYVIGVDFGTLSARAIVLRVSDKTVVSESVFEYRHGVMDKSLPSGVSLPDGFALQHPADYIEALRESVRGAIKKSEVSSSEIGGIGVDFTASTVLPIDKNGTPLAFDERFKNEPHAYVKLWKHHGAQKEADDFTKAAKDRGEKWLDSYGGIVSAEFMLPKILETARYSKDVYDNTYRFIEAGDWINLLLTGNETHAAAFAGYKAFWNEKNGYPTNEYFKSVDILLDGIVGTKISDRINPVSEKAGFINKYGSELTGLDIGTPVSLAMLDAHAAMPALNTTANGNMMIILGTSACHIINSDKEDVVDGIFGCVKNGVIPGKITYEAGQQCFGDAFDWFVSNCVPKSYYDEANKNGIGIHTLLTEKAQQLKIGESGIIALDWFNGNRSVLVNSRLSGMLVGVTIQTQPEEIYRALLEAAVFGAKRITDQFEAFGISIDKITAAGGIASKNALLMQIMADVLNKEIFVCNTTQAAALGSAVYASVAGGFYDDVIIASADLSPEVKAVYRPIEENVIKYKALYSEYLTLHDYFGKTNMVMERLRKIKQDC